MQVSEGCIVQILDERVNLVPKTFLIDIDVDVLKQRTFDILSIQGRFHDVRDSPLGALYVTIHSKQKQHLAFAESS